MFNIHEGPNIEYIRQNQIFYQNVDETLKEYGIEDSMLLSTALACLYSAPSRYYHSLVHINDLFNKSKEYEEHIGKLTKEEKIAIIFHDIIYNFGSSDNEVKSAQFMIDLMPNYGLHFEADSLPVRIIKETANFLNKVEDEETHRVLDLDLSSFANDWNRFQSQNKLIDLEIGKEPTNEVLDKKIDFMKMFLSKEKIYYILPDKIEQKARTNIENYIKFMEEQKS